MYIYNPVTLAFDVVKNEQLTLGCHISLNSEGKIIKENNLKKSIGIVTSLNTELLNENELITCIVEPCEKVNEIEENKMSKLEFMNKD
jgi:hypothetical protein